MKIETDADVVAVVRGFESCETPKEAFRHQDHLTVAVSYLQSMSTPDAVNRMRESLFRFIDHHQVDRRKYHETLTVFWMEMVAECLETMPGGLSLSEQCQRVHCLLGNKDVQLEYYSEEVLWSDEARNSFVKPNRARWNSLATERDCKPASPAEDEESPATS
jgi:hypothetical protein